MKGASHEKKIKQISIGEIVRRVNLDGLTQSTVIDMLKENDNYCGKIILTIMLAFAEYERGMIVERCASGKAIAKQNPSYKKGRPKKYTKLQIEHAVSLLEQGKTYKEVAAITGISKSTLVREKRRTAF